MNFQYKIAIDTLADDVCLWRMVCLACVLLQMRMLYGLRDYTDHHQDILVDLYNLSVSRYGEVGNNDADLWNQKPNLARRIKFNVEFWFFYVIFSPWILHWSLFSWMCCHLFMHCRWGRRPNPCWCSASWTSPTATGACWTKYPTVSSRRIRPKNSSR